MDDKTGAWAIYIARRNTLHCTPSTFEVGHKHKQRIKTKKQAMDDATMPPFTPLDPVLQWTCKRSDEQETAQTLALVLSIIFSLYTGITIAMSAFTLYTTSQLTRHELSVVHARNDGGRTTEVATRAVGASSLPSLVVGR